MANKLDKARIKENAARIKREGYTPVVPDLQMGFIHNNVDCIGCRACEMACKDKNGLSAGPRFRRVQYIEGGVFPNVFAFKINMSCNHCAEPACLPACPTGAIFKRKDNGVVDIDSTLCIGCRKCEAACPVGAMSGAEDAAGFLDGHVLNWMPEFLEKAARPAECALCRAILQMTDAALDELKDELEAITGRAAGGFPKPGRRAAGRDGGASE